MRFYREIASWQQVVEVGAQNDQTLQQVFESTSDSRSMGDQEELKIEDPTDE